MSNIFNLSPEEINKKAGFSPDIVLYNHRWFNDLEYKPLTLQISKAMKDSNISHVLLLNKEYARLNEKIQGINEYGFDFVFSHLHDLISTLIQN